MRTRHPSSVSGRPQHPPREGGMSMTGPRRGAGGRQGGEQPLNARAPGREQVRTAIWTGWGAANGRAWTRMAETGMRRRRWWTGGWQGPGRPGAQCKVLNEKGKTADAGGNCMSHAKAPRRKELRTAFGQDEQDLQDGEPQMHAHGRECGAGRWNAGTAPADPFVRARRALRVSSWTNPLQGRRPKPGRPPSPPQPGITLCGFAPLR